MISSITLRIGKIWIRVKFLRTKKEISQKPPKNTRKVGDHRPFKVAGVFPISYYCGKISILKREEKIC